MAGAMRKMAVYLGLAEDDYRDYGPDGYEDYDGYDGYEEPQAREAAPEREPAAAPAGRQASNVASLPRAKSVAPPAADGGRITTLKPKTYNEARTIGECFRDGVPVIMNLGDMDSGDAKRLVDFAAGLTFGLHGTIERISSNVFLLSPETVSVTTEEKQRLVTGELYNQS